MVSLLPQSVRYVKNGEGHRWWPEAKSKAQVHLGWRSIPHALLLTADFADIESILREEFKGKVGAGTRDFKALRTLLERPSQHLWVTFEDGYMWWCTVSDQIEISPDDDLRKRGHFWLNCALPWRNTSLGGRSLETSNLPGIITATAGYQATVCEPAGSKEILRIINDEDDIDANAAADARRIYERAIAKLVSRLREKDFELLIDLILSRTGWSRVAKLGGVTEGIDIEVENLSISEIAFVQVKSTATQAVFDEYVRRFDARRERYSRMIFAVHTPRGRLAAPVESHVQLWCGDKISELVVRLGLGEWVANRL